MNRTGISTQTEAADQPPYLVLAGPTAVGKSQVALLLAERLNGEIISVDSMQVYRGMDIGTAKPSPTDRARVPHHLIDVVDVSEPFDAARFLELAKGALTDIARRGRLAIFCGGTGLYFQAWLEGLGSAPASDPDLRAQLEKRSLADLLEELARTDPRTFAAIDHQNLRRVVRALEVIRLTGRPFSTQRASWPDKTMGIGAGPLPGLIGLKRDAEELKVRIDRRVDQMFEAGLVNETEQLLKQGLDRNSTALQAIGYRQVVEHLKGIRSLPETRTLVKKRTRLYARRQMTWFRHKTPLHWLTLTPGETADMSATRILASFTGKPPFAESKRVIR